MLYSEYCSCTLGDSMLSYSRLGSFLFVPKFSKNIRRQHPLDATYCTYVFVDGGASSYCTICMLKYYCCIRWWWPEYIIMMRFDPCPLASPLCALPVGRRKTRPTASYGNKPPTASYGCFIYSGHLLTVQYNLLAQRVIDKVRSKCRHSHFARTEIISVGHSHSRAKNEILRINGWFRRRVGPDDENESTKLHCSKRVPFGETVDSYCRCTV
jgi:hypothetical protein